MKSNATNVVRFEPGRTRENIPMHDRWMLSFMSGRSSLWNGFICVGSRASSGTLELLLELLAPTWTRIGRMYQKSNASVF